MKTVKELLTTGCSCKVNGISGFSEGFQSSLRKMRFTVFRFSESVCNTNSKFDCLRSDNQFLADMQ